MRNFQGGAGFGAILAGILSRATPGLPGTVQPAHIFGEVRS